MMKCDMCYDRTSTGKRPMCATVCPSEALYYGTMEEFKKRRPGNPVNTWRFGKQTVTTKVYMVMPEKQGAETVRSGPDASRIDIRLEQIKPVPREAIAR